MFWVIFHYVVLKSSLVIEQNIFLGKPNAIQDVSCLLKICLLQSSGDFVLSAERDSVML